MANISVCLNVAGISCQHCVNSINQAVKSLTGVDRVEVNFPGRQVTVEYDPGQVALRAIIAAIEDQGYEVDDSTV